MNKDDLAPYLALEACPGIGPRHFRRISEADDTSISGLSRLSKHELRELGFNAEQAQFLRQPPSALIDSVEQWLADDSSHHILTLDDEDYPPLLRQIRDAPPILYTLGDYKLLSDPQIAIVGSRNCTPGGASNAEAFAAYLAGAGLTITSGMALGIDKHAHQGALRADGKTIAVIGTGIDRIYPSRNRQLAYDIAEHGLIVSEFPLGTTPIPANFPRRNRIISGLSLATLVVEATQKSGSLITAQHCIEQGREVFAIPGSIHNPQAKGCHQLIRQLAYDIAEHGLIVSEFTLGTTPIPANFPRRNRIISGLSLATLVVEATQKSGSLITAHHGIEQGREVFAIPGSIHNPQAKGCHQLIRQGAKLVDQAADIIDDIASLLGYLAEQTNVEQPQQQELDAEYQQLLQHIGYDPVSIDTLAERSGLTIDQLSSMLLILELNDHIQPAPGGLYSRC